MTTTPTHEAQDSEASARESSGKAIPPGETVLALEGTGDGSPQDPVGAKPIPSDPKAAPEPRTPPAKSFHDNMRDEINARFREDRAKQAETDKEDDIDEFNRAGLPQDFGLEPEPGPEPAPEPIEPIIAAKPAPQMVKIKVRGEEKEVPIEDLIAQAQKSYAAEDYLDEAKARLKSAADFETEIRARAERTAQPGVHPAGKDPAQTGVDPAAKADPQHPEDGKKLVEAFQFGDPEEASRLLNEEIDRRSTIKVDATVKEQLLQQRLRDEATRAAATVKQFAEKHPDIAGDEAARAVIEVNTLRIQTEDLRKLGLDPARIRSDGFAATPADIAQAHRYYRAEGFAVTSAAEMLESALSKYQEWRGVKTPEPTAAAPPLQAAPRIEVSVQRQERRATVSQQPSRTSTPRQVDQPTPARDRSDIVQAMQKRQATLRGTNLGVT